MTHQQILDKIAWFVLLLYTIALPLRRRTKANASVVEAVLVYVAILGFMIISPVFLQQAAMPSYR